MSFCLELKDEITEIPIPNPCCRRAFILGVFGAKGYTEGAEIKTRAEYDKKQAFLSRLLTELYTKTPQVQKPKGGRGVIVSITAPALHKFVSQIEEGVGIFPFEKCAACQNAFLKGVFFAAGRVSDPEKQFSLEFSLAERYPLFLSYFEEAGIPLKVSKKKCETVLYTKNSTQIEDFFAFAELQSATFTVMNMKIKNSFKNDANRRRNFDTVNISKAVDAAASQTEILQRLESRGLINSLPPELEATARLRLANPDMSMKQLALKTVPVISKSGLIHRMDKLLKLAEEILSKYG